MLSANIWLSLNTSSASIDANSELSHSVIAESFYPFAMPSTKGFPFPLMPTMIAEPESVSTQFELSKQALHKRDRQYKRLQQRSAQQLNALRSNNRVLQQALLLAQEQRLVQQDKIAKYQQQIAILEGRSSLFPARQTEIELVRESIQSKPDLIKNRAPSLNTAQVNNDINGKSSDKKQVSPFTGSMEFGFSYEQDNQKTQSINGRLVLDYDKHDQYNINSDLDFEFEDEDGDMTTGKYRWQFQSDYNLDPTNLVYARSDLSRSKFSSYDKENIYTVGYGRIFFNNPRHKFNLEVGPGYRFALPNVGEDAVSVDEFIVRTRINYERVVSESLQVTMDSVLETGHSNSVYGMNFKAQNRIYQQLYLIFDMSYQFTQNVPVDTVNEEASSGLSLLYAF